MRLANVFTVALAATIGLSSGMLSAQDYPTKPVRIVTGFGAGSGPDSVLRVLGEKLTKMWGQQVIVENRPGANGFIAAEAVKKAAPDGYTLLQMDDAQIALQPHLYKKIPYEAKDFEPVGALFRTYFFVVVPTTSSWKSMSDLVAAAKAKPGDLSYGSWFVGSPGHIGAAMLEAETGTQMLHVPFKDTGTMFTAIGNSDVAWGFGTAASSGAMYRAGKVRYIAVAAPKRVAGFENVPTVVEAGGPAGFEVKAWVGLFAPKGTPANIIAKFNKDLGTALAEPDVRERFATFGFEPYAAQPEEVSRNIAADSKRYGDVVKRAKISIE